MCKIWTITYIQQWWIQEGGGGVELDPWKPPPTINKFICIIYTGLHVLCHHDFYAHAFKCNHLCCCPTPPIGEPPSANYMYNADIDMYFTMYREYTYIWAVLVIILANYLNLQVDTANPIGTSTHINL